MNWVIRYLILMARGFAFVCFFLLFVAVIFATTDQCYESFKREESLEVKTYLIALDAFFLFLFLFLFHSFISEIMQKKKEEKS